MLRIRFPNEVPHHRFGFSIGLGHGGLIFLDFYSKVGFRKIWFDHVATLFRQGADELSKFFYLHRRRPSSIENLCRYIAMAEAICSRFWEPIRAAKHSCNGGPMSRASSDSG